jgi:hypothetical protein
MKQRRHSHRRFNFLIKGSKYWLSKRDVQKDWWEAQFQLPQKIDVMYIIWRLAPKSFRIYYKLDPKGEFIPATEVYIKKEHTTEENQRTAGDNQSKEDSIIFNKPIIARVIRIAMNEPLEKKSFSIKKVHFYVKQGSCCVKNQSPCLGKNMCFFVNTDKPKVGCKVEAYSCTECVSCGNNNELFVYNNDRVLIHKNSKMCVGWEKGGQLVLKEYTESKSAYTIQFHHDGSMFFDGYEDDCIVIDDESKISPNFINDKTPVQCTSEADRSFKKENVKCNLF